MEHIYLQGSEAVQTAGHRMSSAAEDMRQAAMNISSALFEHQQFLTDWLAEFRQVFEESREREAAKGK